MAEKGPWVAEYIREQNQWQVRNTETGEIHELDQRKRNHKHAKRMNREWHVFEAGKRQGQRALNQQEAK